MSTAVWMNLLGVLVLINIVMSVLSYLSNAVLS